MRTARTILVAIVVPLLGPLAAAPRVAAQSAITGVVVDARSARPVVGAAVSVHPHDSVTITQDEGRFDLLVAGGGPFVLQTRHVAYATRTDTVVLAAGQNALVRIQLVETAIELPPITVETRSRRLDHAGFFGRRERGVGVFLTRTEMDGYRVQHLSDVFSRVPGLRRSMFSDGTSRIEARGGRLLNRRCDIQYFIDGVRAELGAGMVDAIPIQSVEGIEIYLGASEVPMQFDHGSAMCGAIVVWTRGGSPP
jgi:hypothetical protein